MKTVTTTYRLHTIVATMLCGATALGLTAMPAVADPYGQPLQQTVKFGDLDISRTQGATVLYGRIRAAAKNVCAPFDRAVVPSTRSSLRPASKSPLRTR